MTCLTLTLTLVEIICLMGGDVRDEEKCWFVLAFFA